MKNISHIIKLILLLACSCGNLVHDTNPISMPENYIKLPNPSYWSKCESIDNLTTPDIYDDAIGTSSLQEPNSLVSISSGKMGKALYWNLSTGKEYFYPFGNTVKLRKGTISLWAATEINIIERPFLYIKNDEFSIRCGSNDGSWHYRLELAGGVISIEHNNSPAFNRWSHVFVVWDADGLHDGDTVKLFINGEKILSTKENGISGSNPLSISGQLGDGDGSQIYIDNIKIWNRVITDNPSWEYNNGNGREENDYYYIP